jgi:transposase
MPKVSTLEVIETGARRRWTLEEKQRIVAESFSASRIVSVTARRHGLSTSQLFNWRRQAREGRLVREDEGGEFVSAIVVPDSQREATAVETQSSPSDDSTTRPSGGRMVIVLSGGCRVFVCSDVDTTALRRVLDVLEQR